MIDEAAWLAAWSSRTAEPILELCDPDIEVHAVTLGIEGRHYKGHDGVRQWMRDIRDRFRARARAETLEMLADDALVMTGRLFMASELGEEEEEQRFAMLVHLRDGKARWIGTFFSASDAKAAWSSGVTGPRVG